MKRILTILTVALVVASCSNDEPIEPIQGPAIAFGELGTRVAITDENVEEVVTEFGVWSEMNTGDDGTPEADVYVDLLSNERVYKSGTEWTYDHVRYWYFDRTFHFFAYWPYAATGVEKVTLTGDYPGYKIPFTMTDAADQELLIAHKTEHPVTGGNFPAAVDIDFEHALSQINFKVAKNSANATNRVVLNKLILGGVKNKGNFYTTRIADSDYWEIAASATSLELHPTIKGGELSSYGSGVDVQTVLQNPMLVIPQEVAANTVLLSIEYSFYDVDPLTDVATLVFKTTVNKHLPTITWEAGKSYVYNLTLDEVDNDILFGSPTIANEWGESVVTGGTLIIQ